MRKVTIAPVVLLGLTLGLALGPGCNGPGRWTSQSVGGSVPMSLEPIALAGRDAQGNLINLESYRGQVVLVDVWKTG